MMLETLKTLLAVYGPTGDEGRVAKAIKAMLAPYADEMTTDVMGNLIVTKKSSNPDAKRMMFSAHMDHIGFMVTDIEKEGYLRVSALGGINLDVSITRHVVFGNGVQGVLTHQPVKGGETRGMRHMFVDIGAQNADDAKKHVQIGDVAVYAPDFIPLGDHRVASPAMDDRCACALLCELIMNAKDCKNTLIAVFSTQEEVGLRGATTAAYAINPDLGVAIDVTAWGDTPENKLPAIALGAGPAIKVMDRSLIATASVRDALIAAAEQANVPYQREVLEFGGTDAGAIQHTRAGIPAGTLSVPCRYVHSACETIDMRDMDNGLKLLLRFIEIA